MTITENSDGIKIKGHIGKWYAIDDTYVKGGNHIFLLESETYGDETPCLIVDRTGSIILEDVYNGFDDYYETFDE